VWKVEVRRRLDTGKKTLMSSGNCSLRDLKYS